MRYRREKWDMVGEVFANADLLRQADSAKRAFRVDPLSDGLEPRRLPGLVSNRRPRLIRAQHQPESAARSICRLNHLDCASSPRCDQNRIAVDGIAHQEVVRALEDQRPERIDGRRLSGRKMNPVADSSHQGPVRRICLRGEL
jgi:hypothetical protein